MLALLIAFLSSPTVHANCADMNLGPDKVTVQKDGTILVNRLPFPTATVDSKETGSTFTKFDISPAQAATIPNYNPDLGVKNSFFIDRDLRKRPTHIFSEQMYWDGKKNVEFKPKDPAPETGYERMRLEFSYSKDGECRLERTIASGKHVIFDRGLCDRLGKSMDRLTDAEVAKCDSVLKEMSKAIESFKTELASKHLSWNGQPLGTNTYSAVLIDAANCQSVANPMALETPSLRKFTPKAETAQ